MKHKHHIIPKHMGGTDDPSNLVELTIEDHAEAHKKLWEEYGCLADKIAWECLSGRCITEEDRINLAKEGFKQFQSDEKRCSDWKDSIRKSRKNQVISSEHRRNIGIGLSKAYEEGRKVYVKPSLDFLQENYIKNKGKMEDSRKTSYKWKEAVTSEESRNKKRLSSSRSKKITVDGVTYDSVRQAAKESKYSYYQLRKMINPF
jgi:hypothetical protein